MITRSRAGAVDVWDIGTANSTWFLVETNYDHWLPPLFLDDRRTPAIKCMNEMTQKVLVRESYRPILYRHGEGVKAGV